MQLREGALLERGKYRIISSLGRGGFGITYLAEHVMTKRKVCIKEFFPKDYYTREGDTSQLTLASAGFAEAMNRYKAKFIKEAQTIAAIDHPNIIHIFDAFEDNGTAYYVMEYIEGVSLSSVVKMHGAMSESMAVDYIRQVAAALEYIHNRQIMHLDVKPGNIMVRKDDDRAILIDFGLSKHYDEKSGEATSTTPVGVSHGFAPMEQYKQGGVKEFSPETDIYSLGATLYYLVTGTVPPDAADVADDGLPTLPTHLSESTRTTIERAMSEKRRQRPHSIGEFLSLLDGGKMAAAPAPQPIKEEIVINVPKPTASEETVAVAPKIETPKVAQPKAAQPKTPKPAPTSAQPKKKSKWWPWMLLLLVVVGEFIAFIALSSGGDKEKDTSPHTTITGGELGESIPELEKDTPTHTTITGAHHGHDYVDLGLSVKWATCNVGADSLEEYGEYYEWGATSTNGDYAQVSYDIKGTDMDVAHVKWGGDWRMPTKEEFNELIEKCEWERTGSGYEVTGPNGNSIYLPAAGYCRGGTLYYAGSYCFYWSSSTCSGSLQDAYGLTFYGDYLGADYSYRFVGFAVRPVLPK